MLKKAKDSGMLLEELIKQGDLFGDVDPVVAQMALFIKENNRSPARMGAAFMAMAEFIVKELESRQNASMFDDDAPIDMVDVLKAANAQLKKQYGEDVKAIGGTGNFIDIFTETKGQKEVREQWVKQHTTQESENARTTNVDLESDSETPRNENPPSDGAILNDRGANGTESGITGEPTGGAELPQQGDIGLPEIRPNSVGIPSDSSVDGRNGELGDDSRHSDSAGSSDDGGQGIPDDRQRNSELDATVRKTEKLSREQKKQLQDDAEAIAYAKGEGNIRATLPFLLPEQQDDIVKIEARFETAHGMMITNGTGTGKTYTALGAIKRFAKQGKQSILIVVPGDKIAADFIESAENMHLKIKALEGITDNGGEGIAITSYVYGIGLYIILDVNIINQAAIEQAITQFRLLNETDWQAAIPVPRERLPVVCEQQAFAAI